METPLSTDASLKLSHVLSVEAPVLIKVLKVVLLGEIVVTEEREVGVDALLPPGHCQGVELPQLTDFAHGEMICLRISTGERRIHLIVLIGLVVHY